MSEELGSHTLLVVLFRLVEETVYDDGHKELIPTYELHVCVCVCVYVCVCVCVRAQRGTAAQTRSLTVRLQGGERNPSGSDLSVKLPGPGLSQTSNWQISKMTAAVEAVLCCGTISLIAASCMHTHAQHTQMAQESNGSSKHVASVC